MPLVGRRPTIVPAIVFVCAILTGAKFSYPPGNDRNVYRSDPRMFFEVWNEPKLLNGKETSHGAPTDLALHSVEAKQKYPVLISLLYPFDWEQNFNYNPVGVWCRSHWWISYAASTLYLICLWCGTSIMKDREPFGLKSLLSLWNLFLAVFSFIGAIRTAPHLFAMLTEYGFEYSVCRAAFASYGNGAVGFWASLFIFSKFFELFDTVLLVVRKRKVGFLHWYHHCSVLLYCWHSYVWEMPTGIYFIVMNYMVHSVMYFYYFLASVCAKPPKWALAVTIMQLSQMAVGIGITLSHVYILVNKTVPQCDGHLPNLTAALGMYASYFILFAQFLFNRYCRKRNGDVKKKVADKKLE